MSIGFGSSWVHFPSMLDGILEQVLFFFSPSHPFGWVGCNSCNMLTSKCQTPRSTWSTPSFSNVFFQHPKDLKIRELAFETTQLPRYASLHPADLGQNSQRCHQSAAACSHRYWSKSLNCQGAVPCVSSISACSPEASWGSVLWQAPRGSHHE